TARRWAAPCSVSSPTTSRVTLGSASTTRRSAASSVKGSFTRLRLPTNSRRWDTEVPASPVGAALARSAAGRGTPSGTTTGRRPCATARRSMGPLAQVTTVARLMAPPTSHRARRDSCAPYGTSGRPTSSPPARLTTAGTPRRPATAVASQPGSLAHDVARLPVQGPRQGTPAPPQRAAGKVREPGGATQVRDAGPEQAVLPRLRVLT